MKRSVSNQNTECSMMKNYSKSFWIKRVENRISIYDIRTWSNDHTKYGKGVTITAGEMKVLQSLIKDKVVF